MDATNKVVLVVSRGPDDERSSVAWSVANAAIASDMEVTIFLVSAGADWAWKGAAEVARLNPLDPPIGEMMGNARLRRGRPGRRRRDRRRARDARGRPAGRGGAELLTSSGRETWDAGELGCGRFVVELSSRMSRLSAGSTLEMRASSPGARTDVPAWCRLTGHTLVSAEHPVYIIRRRTVA
jgi:tRNA 2-thiouridine synthesizing protein A